MNTTFKIEEYPDVTFRVGYIPPVELLGLQSQLDFDDFKKVTFVYSYILEHLECSHDAEEPKWFQVKVPGNNTFLPAGLDNNQSAMLHLCMWVIENYILPTFRKSDVSPAKT